MFYKIFTFPKFFQCSEKYNIIQSLIMIKPQETYEAIFLYAKIMTYTQKKNIIV